MHSGSLWSAKGSLATPLRVERWRAWRAGGPGHPWPLGGGLSFSEPQLPHRQDGNTIRTIFFILAIPGDVYLIDVFICVFLMRNDVEHLVLLCHLDFFLSPTWVFVDLGLLLFVIEL